MKKNKTKKVIETQEDDDFNDDLDQEPPAEDYTESDADAGKEVTDILEGIFVGKKKK